MYGAVSWLIQVNARFEALESEPKTSTVSSPASSEPQPPPEIPFSVRHSVRCPGGGDWLGRERNSRSAYVEFTAPEGRVIVEPAHIRVLADSDGAYGPIEYLDRSPNSGAMRVRVHLSCDPDNCPGAGGGWMEIELYDKHTNATP